MVDTRDCSPVSRPDAPPPAFFLPVQLAGLEIVLSLPRPGSPCWSWYRGRLWGLHWASLGWGAGAHGGGPGRPPLRCLNPIPDLHQRLARLADAAAQLGHSLADGLHAACEVPVCGHQLLAELPKHLSLLGVGMEELPVGCGRGVLQAAWGEGRGRASGLGPTVSDWSEEEEERSRVGLARQASSSGEGRRGTRSGCLEGPGVSSSSSSWGIKKQRRANDYNREKDGSSGLGHTPPPAKLPASPTPHPATLLPSLASARSPSSRGKVSAP